MECPNCKYKFGGYWDETNTLEMVEGEYGDFYKLQEKVERYRGDIRDVASVFACPKCGVLFIF